MRSGLPPRCGIKPIIIIIKYFLHLRIYKSILHFLGQHWRVSSVLALTGGHPGPRPRRGDRQLQASQDGCSRPSRGSWLLWGELGLGGPLGLELFDGVECLVESESGCEDKEGQRENHGPGPVEAMLPGQV